MRVAFFLLVLANLLFFAWGALGSGGQEEGREPQRLQNQLQPEKMTVTVVPPASAGPPASAPVVPAAPTPAPPAGAAAASPASVQVCRRIGGLGAKDAGKLQQAAQGAGLAAAVVTADEQIWWVNIPALPNKAAAEKKAGELKALGVTDFHVMQGDSGNLVISLGLFQEEAAAAQFLQTLNRKGVKSARLATRTKPAAAVRVELRGSDEQLGKHLTKLLASTPGATAVNCP